MGRQLPNSSFVMILSIEYTATVRKRKGCKKLVSKEVKKENSYQSAAKILYKLQNRHRLSCNMDLRFFIMSARYAATQYA